MVWFLSYLLGSCCMSPFSPHPSGQCLLLILSFAQLWKHFTLPWIWTYEEVPSLSHPNHLPSGDKISHVYAANFMNSTLCRLFICFLFFFSAIGMFSFTIPSKQQAISLGFQFPVCSIPFCYDQLTSLLCLLLIPYNVSIWFSVEDGLLVPGTLRLALKAQTEEKNGLDSSVQFCASGYACPSSPFIPGARRRSPENQQVWWLSSADLHSISSLSQPRQTARQSRWQHRGWAGWSEPLPFPPVPQWLFPRGAQWLSMLPWGELAPAQLAHGWGHSGVKMACLDATWCARCAQLQPGQLVPCLCFVCCVWSARWF